MTAKVEVHWVNVRAATKDGASTQALQIDCCQFDNCAICLMDGRGGGLI